MNKISLRVAARIRINAAILTRTVAERGAEWNETHLGAAWAWHACASTPPSTLAERGHEPEQNSGTQAAGIAQRVHTSTLPVFTRMQLGGRPEIERHPY
jgi:hypothetical protein